MSVKRVQRVLPQSEYHLLFFSLLVMVAALGQFIYSSRTVLSGLLVVLIPLGISIGLGLFTVRLQQKEYDAEHIRYIIVYGWIGTVSAAAVSGWMLALQYANNLPVERLTDHIVIILSIGVGAGVFVGKTMVQVQQSEESGQSDVSDQQMALPVDREQLATETSWMNNHGPEPIQMTIVQTLTDVEQIGVRELNPLANYIDPDIFDQLRQNNSSQWHLHFQTDKYVIHVSGLGTVSVYEKRSDLSLTSSPF